MWAQVSERRLAHIQRVTSLLRAWGAAMRISPDEANAWIDAGTKSGPALGSLLGAIAGGEGGNRLNRRICQTAAIPSRQLIFFPSA